MRLGPVVDNVIQYNNHVECLDLHLSEITLNSEGPYRRLYLPGSLLSEQGAEGNEVCPTFILKK